MAGCWAVTTRVFVLTIFTSLLAILVPPHFDHHRHNSAGAAVETQHNTNISSQCLQPLFDNCSFYACLEARYHCGPTGYPLGYGQKYCTKFQAARATLSAGGQAWMVATMHCLQVALVPDAIGALGAAATCAVLENKAFATHADCYVHNGVCKLPPSDWEAVLKIVDVKTLFDSWDALKATLAAGTECLELYSFLAEKIV